MAISRLRHRVPAQWGCQRHRHHPQPRRPQTQLALHQSKHQRQPQHRRRKRAQTCHKEVCGLTTRQLWRQRRHQPAQHRAQPRHRRQLVKEQTQQISRQPQKHRADGARVGVVAGALATESGGVLRNGLGQIDAVMQHQTRQVHKPKEAIARGLALKNPRRDAVVDKQQQRQQQQDRLAVPSWRS